MSGRTNPNVSDRPKNLATHYIKWNGNNGNFSFYDNENKVDVILPDDFTFIVLDELHCIAGFSDEHQCGIYSNEIRNIKNDILTAKYFKGFQVIEEGLYKNIRDKVTSKSVGGKYCKSVYVAFKLSKDKDLIIGNIKLTGSGLGGYFEFLEIVGSSLYTGAVKLNGSKSEKKGSNNYFVPIFKLIPLSQESDIEAVIYKMI